MLVIFSKVMAVWACVGYILTLSMVMTFWLPGEAWQLVLPPWILWVILTAWGVYSLQIKVRFFMLLLCVVLLGALRAGWGIVHRVQWSPAWSTGHFQVDGCVLDQFKVKAHVRQFLFQVNAPGHGRVRLSWYYPPPFFAVGQCWRLPVRLKASPGFFNTQGFSYKNWLRSQNIVATGYVHGRGHRLFTRDHTLMIDINRFRQYLGDQINQAVDEPVLAAILIALVTGSRAFLSSHAWLQLQNTGTCHLIAISGLHIGLVATGIAVIAHALLRFFPCLCWRRPRQLVVCSIVFVCVTAYALLAGLSWSTQRATGMCWLSIFAVSTQRRLSSMRCLIWVVTAIVTIQPWALTQAGLWLSTGAVASIVLVQARLQQCRWGVLAVMGWRRRCTAYLTAWLAIQGAIFLLLTPLLIYDFQRVTALMWPANFLAIPWFSWLIVPLDLAAVLICLGSVHAAHVLWHMTAWLLAPLWHILQWLSLQAAFFWQTDLGSAWLLWCLLVTAMACVVPFPRRYVWCFVVGWLPLFLYAPAHFPPGAYRVRVLDAGRGSCVLIHTSHHSLLIDNHVLSQRGQFAVQSVLMPTLYRLHLPVIDTLLVSKSKRGRTQWQASSQLPIAYLVNAEYVRDSLHNVHVMHWVWDGVSFVWHPVWRQLRVIGGVLVAGSGKSRAYFLLGHWQGALSISQLLTGCVFLSQPSQGVLLAGWRQAAQRRAMIFTANSAKVMALRSTLSQVELGQVVSTAWQGGVTVDLAPGTRYRLHYHGRGEQ